MRGWVFLLYWTSSPRMVGLLYCCPSFFLVESLSITIEIRFLLAMFLNQTRLVDSTGLLTIWVRVREKLVSSHGVAVEQVEFYRVARGQL